MGELRPAGAACNSRPDTTRSCCMQLACMHIASCLTASVALMFNIGVDHHVTHMLDLTH